MAPLCTLLCASLLFSTTLGGSTHGNERLEHAKRRARPQVNVVTATAPGWAGTSHLAQAGYSGVSAMQMSVISNDEVLMYDKAENNPLQVNGHSAWGSIYNINTQAVRPLNLQTNSFCAGGGWLSNGTLVSVGGTPREFYPGNSGDVGDGFQGLRLFTPCDDDRCDVFEDPQTLRLTSTRWYPSTVRIGDGSILIIGGMRNAGFNNAPDTDNPSYEFFPPKGNGMPIHSQFLHDALNTNLFPISYLLPDGTIFMAANRMAMIYDARRNKEHRLPNLPNGVIVNYPASAGSALLPLTFANGFTAEVVLFGGSTVNVQDHPERLSSQDPASTQAVRMMLNPRGIATGWIVETMPEARTMADAILTPDGKVLLVNGAQTGVAGYGNDEDRIGASNADHPNYRPTLYDPAAPYGARFSTNFPSSQFERLYHSSASLLADGRIIISGGNPNGDMSTQPYRTHYEVEIFSPPYVAMNRPTFNNPPARMLYRQKSTMNVGVPAGFQSISAVIMDIGYSTHGVHMNNRQVQLDASYKGGVLTMTAPANSNIYPPGYAFLYVITDGIPSKGMRVMIGTGAGPPTSSRAYSYMMSHTAGQ